MKYKLLIILCLGFGIIFTVCAQGNSAPSARSGHAMAYDEGRGVVVLFGGQDNNNVSLDDTWEWSAGKWKQVKITGPSERINAAMVYDADKKRIFLFGGRTKSGADNTCWSYDGQSWSPIVTSSQPPARQLSTMAFDKSKSRVVLFGGMDANRKPLGDTWMFKNGDWTELMAKGPGARASHCITYDESKGAVCIYGGYVDGKGVSEFWQFKNDVWTNESQQNGPGRVHASICYDNIKNRMLLFGGFNDQGRTNEFWEYPDKNKNWAIIQGGNGEVPDPRAEHKGVFIPGQGLFIFGGVIGTDANTRNRSNDTWIYNGSLWNKMD